ncbi:MAG: hypothetical protein LBI72_07640 [Flavobacteriaceae bacterium]|nr:hypothetical protein [Flavobacteriaceae bacterium]
MKTINYIKHMNTWYQLTNVNPEVKPTHISIYLALFQLWNTNRFSEVFIISRAEIMNMAKVGSTTTFSNVMKDMVRWGWIVYEPSQSKYGQSKVRIVYGEEVQEQYRKLQQGRCGFSNNTSGTRLDASNTESDTSISGVTCTDSDTRRGQVVGHINKTINRKQKQLNINQSIISKYDERL